MLEARRQRRRKFRKGQRRVVDVLHHHPHRGIGLEGQLPGDHLIEHYAKRINIRSRRALAAHAHFRGHVRGRPHHRAAGGQTGKCQHLGDAEVGQHWLAVLYEHNVGRFDIPVHHAALMCVIECVGNAYPDPDSLFQRQRSFRQTRFERWPIDELHHHVVDVQRLVIIEVVDLHDVGMTQRGHDARFAFEAGDEPLFIRQEGVQYFDGHHAA